MCLFTEAIDSLYVFPFWIIILDTWRRGRGQVHMAVSDLNGHDRPPHSACTLRHLPREAVPPEVPDGAVLFPPAPGLVPMYFVWEVGGLSASSIQIV